MKDTLNNLFGNNSNGDDIIDKKRLEKNIDNIADKNDNEESETSIGSKIFSGILILATVIFSIIFTVLITSNLSFLITLIYGFHHIIFIKKIIKHIHFVKV